MLSVILVRLHAFLASVNPRAAAQAVQQLVSGAEQLLRFPQLGAPLDEFAPRDVRRLIMGDYELRYECTPNTITSFASGVPGRIDE